MPKPRPGPAIYVEPQTQFGQLGNSAAPIPMRQHAIAVAAAWAQHRFVQSFRTCLPRAGFHSPADFIRRNGLPSTYKKIIRGAVWVTMDQMATMIALIGQPMMAALDPFSEAMAMALPRPGMPNKPRPKTRYSRRPPELVLNKAGFSTPQDVLWASALLLAEQQGVEPPDTLTLVDGETFDAAGDPGGALIVAVPETAWSDIRLLGERALLGDPGEPVFLDLVQRDGEWEYEGVK